MKILIVSDIFGQHQDLDDFGQSLTHSPQFTIVDPYQAKRFNFADEDHAYQTFLAQCGHENYVNIILEQLNNSSATEKIMIIAFSAGAAATWRAIANLTLAKQANIKHFIGFYPSQIRHHLNLSLNCPTTLYFPDHESHFSVTEVINDLKHNLSTKCIKTPYLHGFMNPQSVNYNSLAAQEHKDKIQILANNDH